MLDLLIYLDELHVILQVIVGIKLFFKVVNGEIRPRTVWLRYFER